MSLNIRRLPVALLTAVLVLASGMAGARDEDTASKWRVYVAGAAKTDGEVVMRLSEVGAVVSEVPVAIPKHMDKSGIAHRIRDRLNESLDGEKYKVVTDDKDDVVVRARDDVKDFELAIVRNTADGTEVKVERQE
jgi:hypothetical protein